MLCVVLGLAGCDRNSASPFLIPTGVRPAPEVGTGAVHGQVVYDPAQTPDLTEPPFPPTVVELWMGDQQVAADTLARDVREFRFERLRPGTYTVVAVGRLFKRSSIPPLRVVDRPVDAGDVLLPFDFEQTSSGMYLYGDFNGFAEYADSTAMQQFRLGLWFGPNLDPVSTDTGEIPPDTALTLEAGVHALDFALNFAGLDNPHYGGDGTVVDAPVTNAPLVLTSDPTAHLRVRFPTTGRYRFFVDERRLTLTIESLPAPPVAKGVLR